MAFNREDLFCFSGTTGDAPRFFSYATEDTLDDMLSADYFSSGYRLFRAGDMIQVEVKQRLHSLAVTSNQNRSVVVRVSASGTLGPDTIEITDSADLDVLAVDGVITISDRQLWIIKTIIGIETPHRIVLNGGNLSIVTEGGRMELAYTGAGTFVSGRGNFSTDDVTLNQINSATLFGLTSGLVSLSNGILSEWDDYGSISGSIVNMTNMIFFRWSSGFNIKNCRQLNVINSGSTTTPTNQDLFTYENIRTDNAVVSILGANGVLGTSSYLNIRPAILDSTRISVSSSVVTSGNLFNTSGLDGTFTAVVDAAISPTTVDSVIDSPDTPGRARFLHSGTDVYVDQIVITAGFATSGYNKDRPCVAAGSGYFEIEDINFVINEVSVGNYSTESVTLTDTGTAVIEGDDVDIQSDGATDYDGGSVAFNVQANSFQINRAVTVPNPQTGTWSTRGLNQKDIKVLASNNPGFLESKYIGCGVVNDNLTAVGPIVNLTYTDVVFGTAGSALIECTNTERFKLLDEINGTFEYVGNESFDGVIPFSVSATSSGGAQEFRFKMVKSTDGGGLFVDLDNLAIAADDIANTMNNTGASPPATFNKGDQFKMQVTRVAGISGLTIRFCQIEAIG